MALLGAQLVITFVMMSVIQKLSPHFSLGKWLLCSTGLTRYLHPTDHELRTLAGVPKDKTKNKRDRPKNGSIESDKSTVFHVPRNLGLTLETAKISQYDVIHLRYYTEYQWLVDFSLYASLVYLMSEIYHGFFPIKDEMNLSMMWCLLVIFFAFKLLVSLTVQYFRSEESIGERSTCIVTGLVYLLISMVILIIDESILETGLEKAYTSFNSSASVFLEHQGLNSSGPASKIVIKFFIAVSCGVLGAVFTFPGMRMAQMHWDSLYYTISKPLKVLLNVSFAMPFILVILWIKPISRDYLTVRIFSGMETPILTSESFDTIRLFAIVFTVLLRLALMPFYLQAYLNLAFNRIQEQKKELGRITNVDLQKKIASIFYYLCVVTVQYVAPIIMCLYIALMYKTLGEYTWTGAWNIVTNTNSSLEECSANLETPLTTDQFFETAGTIIGGVSDEETNDLGKDLLQSAEDFQLSFQSLKAVFTIDVYRGLFGFATWWTCFVWFASTSLGMIYQTYFSNS